MVNKLIQGNDLVYMRSEVQMAMPDQVDIHRKTNTADGQGGFTESWSSVYQDVSARLTATNGAESTDAQRQDLQADYVITLPSDQSIEQTDRIVHTSGTYAVQFVDVGKSWSTSKRCQIRKL